MSKPVGKLWNNVKDGDTVRDRYDTYTVKGNGKGVIRTVKADANGDTGSMYIYKFTHVLAPISPNGIVEQTSEGEPIEDTLDQYWWVPLKYTEEQAKQALRIMTAMGESTHFKANVIKNTVKKSEAGELITYAEDKEDATPANTIFVTGE